MQSEPIVRSWGNREIVGEIGKSWRHREIVRRFCRFAASRRAAGHRTAHVARRRLRGCGSVNTNPFFVRLRAQFEVNLEVVVIGSKFAHLLIAGIRALLVHPIIGQSQLTARAIKLSGSHTPTGSGLFQACNSYFGRRVALVDCLEMLAEVCQVVERVQLAPERPFAPTWG